MLSSLQNEIGSALVERDSEVRAILLGLVAREHVLLVGPPGTAKSHLCRSVAAGVSGMKFCERLLAPTTPPEALFGPVSLKALREDRYEHVGDGTVTDAHLLFLDEVFRASDAIADTMLHLLGPERQALIGSVQVKVPLISAIGATNSWPDSAHQSAMLDRWLIRRTVKPVSPQGRDRLLYDALPAVSAIVTREDLDAAHISAMALPISDAARTALSSIFAELTGNGIRPSDRRCRKSLTVARSAAFLDGATEVEPAHLECLGDVLWDDPNEQPEKCADIVTRIANPVGARINELLREVDDVVRNAADAAQRMAAIKKLEQSEGEAKKLVDSGTGNGRAAKCLQFIRRERIRLQAEALGIDPAKAEAMLGGK